MILQNQNLVTELRRACNNAKNRIWIAVPFIGHWKSVERILGRNWMMYKDIDIRIITDIDNGSFSEDTYSVLKQYAKMRSLSGLHAKLYIIDNFILLTSANLTGTAFSKRFEIGVTVTEEKNIVKIFKEWWRIAEKIEEDWKPAKPAKTGSQEPEDHNTGHLPYRWNLPPISKQRSTFSEYISLLSAYNNFVKLYEKNCPRLIPRLSVYQEVDGFFNYLFHEHPLKPSYPYMEKEPYRPLNEENQIKEIKSYAKQYMKWLTENPTFENYRFKCIRTIKKHLSKSHIDILSESEVKEVVNCLHCMNSFDLNKYRFTNPSNNKIEVIRAEWKNLLHNNSIELNERMETCSRNLRFFGKSAIRELIGWYYPEKYPIINRNSNSGMRFFGYDIKVY